jgi:hypothetical protein
MKRRLLKLGVFLMLCTMTSIVVAVVIPVVAESYEKSQVWLDADRSLGWRSSDTLGQQWIDVDKYPREVRTEQELGIGIVSRGLEIDDDLWELLCVPARFVDGGRRTLPTWVGLSADRMEDIGIAVTQGWPCHALCHYRVLTKAGEVVGTHGWIPLWPPEPRQFRPPLQEIGIPTHVRMPQMIMNVATMAAILWLLWIIPGRVRRYVRIRWGRCPACGYQIAPGVGDKCSECGAPAVTSAVKF